MALIDNCVAAYKLDETSGSSIKDEVSGSNGTLTNATQNSGGKIGYCTSFSGSGYYGTCPSISSNISSTNRVSINAWIYGTSSDFRMIAVERQQSGSYYLNFQIAKETDNKINFGIYGANNTSGVNIYSTNPISLNTRTMVTGIYDSSKVKLYINGVFEIEANQTAELATNSSSNFMIGRNSPLSSSQDFNGRIDEVCVWNKALTSTEITALYNSGAGLQYPFTGTTIFTPKIIQF